MRDLIADIEAWRAGGHPVAIATVVETWGSAPRRAGAAMAVGPDGRLAGSVSGGCVEAAVIEAATALLDGVGAGDGDREGDGRDVGARVGEGSGDGDGDGRDVGDRDGDGSVDGDGDGDREGAAVGDRTVTAPRLLAFDVSDGTAQSVGLPCGGRLRILVERLAGDPATARWLDALCTRAPVARLVGLSGALFGRSAVAVAGAAGPVGERRSHIRPEVVGELAPLQAAEIEQIARTALIEGRTEVIETDDGLLAACAYPPPERLVIVGAVHIAQSLARLARELGDRVLIVDPRAALATRERFPTVDEIVVQWPDRALAGLALDRATDVVVLTHDDKLDDAALAGALRSEARYVGALGSRRRAAMRMERLAAAGLSGADLERLDAPIGLDIGARTPAEIAVSVVARLVEVRSAAAARPPTSR